MEQRTTLTGLAVEWLGPPQHGWVAPSYWKEVGPLPPHQRRLPTPEERPVLPTGTRGAVGELLHADSSGHVYVLRFPVTGGLDYELEIALPCREPGSYVRILDETTTVMPPASLADRRRYATTKRPTATATLLRKIHSMFGGRPTPE